MYVIRGSNNGEEFDILEVRDEELLGYDAVVREGINKVPSLAFTLPATNASYGLVHKLTTEISVIDLNGEVEVFRGRCVSDETDFWNTKACVCEGTLAYLLDSMNPPYLHTGSLSVFLRGLLDEHNRKVSEKQKVYLGTVSVTDPNDYMRRESKYYASPLSIIQDKIVKSYGGLLQVRRTLGKNYLDYLKDYPASDQVVKFGENLLDLRKYSKAEEVRTVIIPLGAEDESGNRVTIESVNGGKNYLVDESLVAEYGWIEEAVYWDDVTLPSNLLKKGQDYLAECRNMSLTIELNAVDARLYGVDVQRIHAGMLVKVESIPHGLNSYFLCTSREIDLLNPENDKIVLGNEMGTYTDASTKKNKDIQDKIESTNMTVANEIQDRKDQFNDYVKNANGLYPTDVVQSDGSVVHYLHNRPKLADSDIQITVGGAGIAVSADGGHNWYGMQVDGDMIAKILSAVGINAAWVNVGEMLADRIKGGTLTLGGQDNKNGTIRMLGPDGKEIGKWDGQGIVATGEITATILKAVQSGQIGPWSFTSDALYRGSNALGNRNGMYFGTKGMSVKDAFVVDESGNLSATNAQIAGGSLATQNYNKTLALKIEGGMIDYYPGMEKYGIARSNGNGGKIDNKVSDRWSVSLVDVSEGTSEVPFLVSKSPRQFTCNLPVVFSSGMSCSGSKSRECETKNYGKRLNYCYEMPSPMFGDIGEGVTDENGECYIYLDDVFAETVSAQIEYQVFLQKEGNGEMWVEQKTPQYFVVKGTPGMRFAWEAKAKQKGYECERMESHDSLDPQIEKIGYFAEYESEIRNLIEEREGLMYETA